MRCAVGSGSSGRHSRGRRSTYDEQAQQGQKQHACCTQLQSILVRNRGLGTARFAELAAGAGACLRRLLKRRKLAPTKRVTASRIFRRGLVEFTPPLS